MLQQGLPQDNNLYLVIEGHDSVEDIGDGGGQQRMDGGVMSVAMVVNNRGGGGIINPLLIWFYDKILISTYFYSVPLQETTQPASNLLATCYLATPKCSS